MSESEELLKAKDDEILAMQETNKELLARLHACTCDIARLTSMCKKSTLEGTKEEDEETIHDTIQPQVCKVYTTLLYGTYYSIVIDVYISCYVSHATLCQELRQPAPSMAGRLL